MTGQASVPAFVGQNQQDQERLDALWKQRTATGNETEFPIGPGDVLEISVPAVEELKDRMIRVSGDNTVSIPMLGVIKAGGLTEEQLRQELRGVLAKYMYNPEVNVFVKEYRSRQVAVFGAVRYPGLITLASPSDTILDMISEAGGMIPEAADQVVLIPSNTDGTDITGAMAALSVVGPEAYASKVGPASDKPAPGGPLKVSLPNAGQASKLNIPFIPKNADPIVIALPSVSLSANDRYLNLPVRPGDVIIVPAGGEVMVIGWVQNPGHFAVGSGLTVMGAIGAAGGAMFAADKTQVKVFRSEKSGEKRAIPIDLEKIAKGTEVDPLVRANDVIQVPYSDSRIGPYVVYTVLTRMGFGLAIPTF